MTSKALIRAEALDGWAEILEERGLDFHLLSRDLNKNIKKTGMGHDAIILSEFVEFLERASSESHTPGLAWSAGHTANYARVAQLVKHKYIKDTERFCCKIGSGLLSSSAFCVMA